MALAAPNVKNTTLSLENLEISKDYCNFAATKEYYMVSIEDVRLSYESAEQSIDR